MSPDHYASVVKNCCSIHAGDDWNERFIVALFINRLKLAAEPTEPYHIMAPMPVMGSPVGWEQAYIVESS